MSFNFLTSQISMNKAPKSVTAGTSSSQNLSGKSSVADLFITKFNQMLAKNGINSSAASQTDLTKTAASSSAEVDILAESVKRDLLKEINTVQGFEFLTTLKQYLMASGYGDLNGISIGENGLDAVKVMLDKAGFDNSKVAQLIDTLKSESDNAKVSLSALIDGLLSIESEDMSAAEPDSPLDTTNSDNTSNDSADSDAFSIEKKSDKKGSGSDGYDNYSPQILDLSAVPFISSIMKSLGVPDNITDSIISNSEVKGEGLNLTTLIGDLQSLQKTSFFTGISFQNDSDVDSIKDTLQQLGLSVNMGQVKDNVVKNSDITNTNRELKSQVTLGDFVSALEGFRQKEASKDILKEVINKVASNSKLSEDISITGLNKSIQNGFTLLQGSVSANLQEDVSESDNLIKQFINSLENNNPIAAETKEIKKDQTAETEMRYRELKSAKHQLLMNLSENSQQTQDSANSLSNIDNPKNIREIQELFDSLGIIINSKSDLKDSDGTLTSGKLKSSSIDESSPVKADAVSVEKSASVQDKLISVDDELSPADYKLVSVGDKSVSVEEAKLDKILTSENAQAAKELKELLASLGIIINSKSDLKDSDGTLTSGKLKSSSIDESSPVKADAVSVEKSASVQDKLISVDDELSPADYKLVSVGDKSVSVEEAKLDKILTSENAQAAKELKELLASLGIIIKSKSDLKDSDSTLIEEAKLDKILTNENAQAAKELKELLLSLGIDIKENKLDGNKYDDSEKLIDTVPTSRQALKQNSSDIILPLVSESTTESFNSLSAEKIKDIKELLSSLGIEIKENSNTTNNIDAETQTGQTNKLNLKNSSEFFNETSQKRVINNAEIEKEQNSKIMAGMNANAGNNISISALGTNTTGDVYNGNIISDMIQSLNSSETLISGKKSERNSRSNVNESGSDSIISRLERKESLTVSDSNNSSDKNFFNQNDNRGTSLGAAANKSASSVLPSYVTNQVVRSINRAITSGENEIRLQLRPAELGRIFMTIETVGDTLNVSIVAENQSAKDILTGHANDLKSSLANNGITIGNFDVEVGSDFKQSMANSGQQFQSGSDSGRNNSSSGQRSSISTDEIEGVQTILNNEDGNLHFVA